ncbi:glycosyltransferase [Zunongwangia sp. F363]|uniref:Glycosyltransferase n=1 Tax=Autumnicola tepida TaxID=3075595 RepID=A0ABU3C841_9FLAO|nr:glycosyltransferase [Zunongwangia sp. F363]MDT0642510.1 glycosyltransferase [Zunongwangia sp. F363]
MKILHVIEGMDPQLGGVCKAVRTIVKGLSGEEVKNEVLSLDDPEAAFLKEDNFPVYALGPAKSPWSYSKGLVPWLQKNLEDYDFVIIHGLWLYNSYATYKAFKNLKEQKRSGLKNQKCPRLYIMPHGMLDPYFQKVSTRKIKAVRNTLYWKFIESKVINAADGILFTCEEERRLAHEPFHPYKPGKEIVVGLGTEAPPAYELSMTHAFGKKCDLEGRTYILFLSRIHEKKGVENLIKAYEFLVKKNQADLPALVIAGPGKESSYGRKVTEMVEKNQMLRELVFFPGMLTAKDKWGAFYGCEAFILPSEQENFGIAIVEALACAKAVLISDQVNIWREIEEASAGMVAPASLSGTIKLLENWFGLSDPQKAKIGLNAAECYKNQYAMDSFVNQWKESFLFKEAPSLLAY